MFGLVLVSCSLSQELDLWSLEGRGPRADARCGERLLGVNWRLGIRSRVN